MEDDNTNDEDTTTLETLNKKTYVISRVYMISTTYL